MLPLKMPDGKPPDIFSWWKLHDHKLPADPGNPRPEGLPCLARMARQYHGEPGSSAGAERLFSAASRAHHDLEASMGDMSLEHQLLALANTDRTERPTSFWVYATCSSNQVCRTKTC